MPMQRSLEKVLQYDRWVVIALLMTVTISSWLFVIKGAGTGMSAAMMTGIDLATGGGMRMPAEMPSWTFAYAIIMFFMWWIMMIAMMLPSASPTILLFARARHDKQETDKNIYLQQCLLQVICLLGPYSVRLRSLLSGPLKNCNS